MGSRCLDRSDAAWKKTFVKAGLTLIHEQLQRGFPEGLYDVKMSVLDIHLSPLIEVADPDHRYALR